MNISYSKEIKYGQDISYFLKNVKKPANNKEIKKATT